MKKDGRYDVTDLPEAQFESGSNEEVLKNKPGIKSKLEMDEAEAGALERAMDELGAFNDKTEVVRALAETHTELVLIHPFREGNGRVARILSTLMALPAGMPLLDFSLIAEEKKNEYFAAVQAGLDKNYKPMEKVFSEIIERTPSTS